MKKRYGEKKGESVFYAMENAGKLKGIVKGDVKMKISKKLLAWRRRQKRGAIMKPSTFEKIKEKAAAAGAANPEAVAGAAYWKTAKEKYEKSRK